MYLSYCLATYTFPIYSLCVIWIMFGRYALVVFPQEIHFHMNMQQISRKTFLYFDSYLSLLLIFHLMNKILDHILNVQDILVMIKK